MALSATNYGHFNYHTMRGEIVLQTDTIKVGLVTSTYTFNKDTHDSYNDITNELGTANGYTIGGLTLSGKTITYTAGIGSIFDANDAVWTNPGAPNLTARGAFVYKSTGVATTSWLISFVDFGADKSTSNDTFTIQWDNTNGICYVSA